MISFSMRAIPLSGSLSWFEAPASADGAAWTTALLNAAGVQIDHTARDDRLPRLALRRLASRLATRHVRDGPEALTIAARAKEFERESFQKSVARDDRVVGRRAGCCLPAPRGDRTGNASCPELAGS